MTAALVITFIACFVLPFMLYAAVEDSVRLVGLWWHELAYQKWRRKWPHR